MPKRNHQQKLQIHYGRQRQFLNKNYNHSIPSKLSFAMFKEQAHREVFFLFTKLTQPWLNCGHILYGAPQICGINQGA